MRANGQESRARKVVGFISNGFAFLAVSGIVFAMFSTTADVLRRMTVGASIRGVIEFSEVLMVVIAYLGLAYAERRRAHVSMTMVVKRLPPRVAAGMHAFGVLLALIVILIAVLATFERALDSFAANEHRFGLVRIYIWPARFVIVIGLVAFFAELVFRFIDAFAAMIGRRSPEDAIATVSSDDTSL